MQCASYMIGIMSQDFLSKLIAKTEKSRLLAPGQTLFRANDPVRSLFVVAEGRIDLKRHQEDGTTLILQRATDLSILAEASLYSETYHCDAIAASSSLVNEISKPDFLDHLHKDPDLASSWAAYLAKEVQTARYRSEILSHKTVAERLGGWLVWQGKDLPVKGQWKNIAMEIGVSPEALYREIAKRRQI